MLLNWRWSSQPPIFFQVTAKGGSRATPRKSPLFKLFFFLQLHIGGLPLGPAGVPVCAPNCISTLKKSYSVSLPNRVSFTHLNANTQRWVLSKVFHWILYVAFLFFFCWQVHILWIIAAMVLEIESLNINNMSRDCWCFISHSLHTFCRLSVFVFQDTK